MRELEKGRMLILQEKEKLDQKSLRDQASYINKDKERFILNDKENIRPSRPFKR